MSSLVVAMLPSAQFATEINLSVLVPFMLDINGMSLRTCQFDLYSTSVLVIQMEVRKKVVAMTTSCVFQQELN